MVTPLRDAWRLTSGSSHETPGTVKLLLPPQQSWGISQSCLEFQSPVRVSAFGRDMEPLRVIPAAHAYPENSGQYLEPGNTWPCRADPEWIRRAGAGKGKKTGAVEALHDTIGNHNRAGARTQQIVVENKS